MDNEKALQKPLYEKILPTGRFRTFSQKPDLKLIQTKQVHSTELALYQGERLEEVEVDGIVFSYEQIKSQRIAIAVKTADCMPIVFLGEKKAVFLHAGWRGLANGILSNPMIKEIQPHSCFIGPSICLESFEVQSDFKSYFSEDEFYRNINGKTYFDLHGKAAKDIHLLYPGINLEISSDCTLKQEKFHSYRRNKTKQRNWNIFTL